LKEIDPIRRLVTRKNSGRTDLSPADEFCIVTVSEFATIFPDAVRQARPISFPETPTMRWMTALCTLLSATSLFAGEVTVSHVHLCCGSCTAAVDEALTDVAGVSDVGADQNTKTIRFAAADDKAAEAGIQALAKHGFFGQAKHAGKKLAFPANGAKKGEKANQIVLHGVHLCCGACVTGAKKSLENVAGLSAIEVDRAAGKITLKGAGIETTKALEALNAGGFFATVNAPEVEEKKEK